MILFMRPRVWNLSGSDDGNDSCCEGWSRVSRELIYYDCDQPACLAIARQFAVASMV